MRIVRRGRTGDCFAGYLPRYYRQFGFEEVGRLPFNRDYAPPDWNYEKYGEPDVVFIRWKGFDGSETSVRERATGPKSGWLPEQPSTRYFDSYDEGKIASRE
jgi:hypothetical protein